ncbi:ATP-binding protein [Actinoplanes derwentensis]|uniref:Transcriptional regulator, contains XRE-family HTH domain n=1 Tax=Actinoplanes derwentensis TaxID=113562 RepID=A0A1H1RI51_9ACTN|nr:NB-ARC domain-containing protein [Actinoplanes derwentensis]GID84431.1 hypothetical protein Ade03nite_33550 [Actinoplanes derwentensis]SDS35414.1 Transcriptional regulator, contains XRE-family HTH domain [Actinoplanes derwentensis]
MFGQRLRELRIAAGLTLEGLAESSGVSVRAVSDMERGLSRAPWPRTVDALVAALAHPDAASLPALAKQAREAREAQPARRRRPADLPRADRLFVGRREPIDRIAAHAAGRTPVAVVHGPPGVGKSALALRLAEHHPDLFPDGRFHLDLRGTDGEPATVADLQNTLLRALAVSPRQIAADAADRTGQLRDALRQRRCLIILDDAADEAQVRPLLPATGHSLVLVTSRQSLGGLEAVLRIALDPFDPAESAQLLREVAGPGSGTDEQVARVADLCGHLPLALRIAGQTGGSMAHLAERLTDADRRLSALTPGGVGVETAFAVSYRRLPEPSRLLFRRIAHLVPGSFSAATLAVPAECDPYDAEDILEDLVERGLVRPDGFDRYRLHDLLRLFAGTRLRAEEPAELRAAVRQRLHRWYLNTTIAAARSVSQQAGDWLRSEMPGWQAALREAAEAGDHQRVAAVADGLCHWSLVSTEAYGDHDGYVDTMVTLGVLHESRGRSSEAVEQYRRALDELERRPLSPGSRRLARVTVSIRLARALGDAGRWAECRDAAETAWPLADDAQLRGQAAMVLGWACAATGDSERARELLREASELLGGSA